MYEILMYLNLYFFQLFATFKICCTVLKPLYLRYPENALTREASILLALIVVEAIRIVLGRRSSLSDRGKLNGFYLLYLPKITMFSFILAWQAIASVILTLPNLGIVIYLCFFQTYTLKLELIMSALMIALYSAELIFAFIFICTMCRPVSYT